MPSLGESSRQTDLVNKNQQRRDKSAAQAIWRRKSMSTKAKVIVDELLGSLFKNENISDRDEIRFSVCQIMKTLGLVKLDVTTDPECPEIIDLCYYHTEELENILRDD
jgi:hypothetical protein